MQLSSSDFSLLVQLFALVQRRCETLSCEVGSVSCLLALLGGSGKRGLGYCARNRHKLKDEDDQKDKETLLVLSSGMEEPQQAIFFLNLDLSF